MIAVTIDSHMIHSQTRRVHVILKRLATTTRDVWWIQHVYVRPASCLTRETSKGRKPEGGFDKGNYKNGRPTDSPS